MAKLGVILQVIIVILLAIIIALVIYYGTSSPKPVKSHMPAPARRVEQQAGNLSTLCLRWE